MRRRTRTALRGWLRGLAPAVAPTPAREALRAGLGAFLGLLVAGAFVLSPAIDLESGLYLVAPFGATSVLIFAVPNSPLAQPWSAVAGNAASALVGVAACLFVPDPALRIAVAVGGAIVVMGLLRAMHPPGGAVAMTAAMGPEAIRALGFGFALVPVALGTALLVALAMVYARATGRRYPHRQFGEPNAHGTADAPAAQRLGLSEAELSEILERYRQSLNLGVEDLARLIGAAEIQAAGRRAGPATAAQIMSRDLVTVGPDTPLETVADLFDRHGFTSLPVTAPDGSFLGVIFQLHLIRRAVADRMRLGRGFPAALSRLLDRGWSAPARAGDVMAVGAPRATTATPLGALLPMLAEGGTDAVPILHAGRLVGIVTRTDMIAALARGALRG
ncbi:HPP family protein [Albimonas pacifica]|uniref:CBS domain-containing membrane protein n=1 Tax=Albimonas pacifica TaxID=1114924 RepID=A0A1I3CKL0_9RHOB|nr:HPP family protein [Albimonas pacifica]SFH74789.1 CBS domain-containing membrane protein [Albimonas pacifica]